MNDPVVLSLFQKIVQYFELRCGISVERQSKVSRVAGEEGECPVSVTPGLQRSELGQG